MSPGFSPVIKADCRIQPKEPGVSGSTGMEALNPVFPSAGRDIAVPVQDQIDLFRHFVVMREIRPARRKLHQEEAGHHDAAIQPVIGALPVT